MNSTFAFKGLLFQSAFRVCILFFWQGWAGGETAVLLYGFLQPAPSLEKVRAEVEFVSKIRYFI